MPSEAPRGEVAALVAVQSALADRPGVLTAARGLSYFGEHSIGWLAVALLGAALMPRRRRDWLVAGAGAFAAHAAAVLVKRLVRRKRPHHPSVAVNVGTPSQLSFPSAHATSTTAAAILMSRATGLPAMAPPSWYRRWRCRGYCWGCTIPATWPSALPSVPSSRGSRTEAARGPERGVPNE